MKSVLFCLLLSVVVCCIEGLTLGGGPIQVPLLSGPSAPASASSTTTAEASPPATSSAQAPQAATQPAVPLNIPLATPLQQSGSQPAAETSQGSGGSYDDKKGSSLIDLDVMLNFLVLCLDLNVDVLKSLRPNLVPLLDASLLNGLGKRDGGRDDDCCDRGDDEDCCCCRNMGLHILDIFLRLIVL